MHQLQELAKKVQLSRIRSRLHAFQRAIDEVRMLPLTPQRVAQKANLSLKNRFPYISVSQRLQIWQAAAVCRSPSSNHSIRKSIRIAVRDARY